MGKHKPVFEPGRELASPFIGMEHPEHFADDHGDYVVVTNVRDTVFTDGKEAYRQYRSHTGYKGAGITKEPVHLVRRHKPDTVRATFDTCHRSVDDAAQILRHAVSGMLPKNAHRWTRLQRLRTFVGTEHPYKRNLIQRYDYGAPELPAQNVWQPERPESRPAQDATRYGVEAVDARAATGLPTDAKPYGRPLWYNSKYSPLKTTNHAVRPATRRK
jgi:ribosomal protein L13